MRQNLFNRTFEYTLAGLLIVFLLSGATFFSPMWFHAAFWLVVGCTLFLGLWRFDRAVFILLAELFAGSQGRLLSVDIFGFSFSLRMALFAVVAVLWLAHRRWKDLRSFQSSPVFWWMIVLMLVLSLGVLIGYLSPANRTNLFSDANAFVFILSGFFFFSILRSPDDLQRVLSCLAASIVFSTLVALTLLAFFSHGYDVVSEIYRWVRDTRMFEITSLGSNYFRLFSQAHIFSVLAFFLFLPMWAFGEKPRGEKRFLLFILFCASVTLFLGFSRSFWLAILATVVFALPWILRTVRPSKRRLGAIAGTLVILLLADSLLLTFVANYPLLYGRTGEKTTIQLLGERTTDISEPAASSRYALFKPLLRAGLKNPIFGSGFGSTVTYTTADPRIVAQTGGSYTTFAFEWGYLDLFLKLGVLGLFVIFGLFISLLRESRALLSRVKNLPSNRAITVGFVLGLVALFVTHALSPYLNHPTGLGFLMLMGAAVSALRRGVPDQQDSQ